MKKLVFMVVAFAAISFASCGNKAEQAAPANDSDSIAVVDTAADSAAVVSDSAATEAPAEEATEAPAAE